MDEAFSAGINTKIVSLEMKYITAFVAKRKKNSYKYIKELVGRELDHIKRINLILTSFVKNGYAHKLPKHVQVEVLPQGQG